jgi:hypothetical protein
MPGFGRKRRMRDLSGLHRALLALAGTVQVLLLAAAQVDLLRRPASEVRGPKWVWRTVALVNFVGPITYFLVGRRTGAGA